MGSSKLLALGLLCALAIALILSTPRFFNAIFSTPSNFPTAADVTVESVKVTDGGFVAKLRGQSREPAFIAQVMVDGGYWMFSQQPAGPIVQAKSAQITIEFPWVETETHHLKFISSRGETFEYTVDVALPTPRLSRSVLVEYTVLGLCVGLLPISLGMLFFPSLKTLGAGGREFLTGLTIGLLSYLLIDMVVEGLELSAQASPIFGGPLLVIIPMVLTAAVLLALNQGSEQRNSSVRIAALIALGIGLHNFGEGLAIGGSIAANKISLGAYLVIGFALHNISEGFGLVSPLTKDKIGLGFLVGLALVAGLPIIPGIWLGVFSFSPHWAAAYFGIGAGAIAQVIVEIDRFAAARAQLDRPKPRFNAASVAGYCAGAGIMYATALLIAV
ncbi:MAG: ZIP family zinc transporter [Gammaproteobacteria bacterium]|jgi:ZIP family zinc transporter